MQINGSPQTLDTIGWKFDNTYSRLPAVLHVPAQPAAVGGPRVVILNHRLANELGLDFHSVPTESLAALFAGQLLPTGAQPIAQAYAGHQYGYFTMLGDGRAILIGEHRTPSGKLVDIQLKGSGQTAFSRRGDGRAALGPMLREYIISEAMHALGIPSTRSLAVVATCEPVYRETPLPGAILTRVAASHIRFGTFEYVAARRDEASLRLLADHAIERHYPEIVKLTASERYVEFFRAVMDRQAALVAKWQMVGFIHGVMNTDNMAISGETIDYGPCAFMNVYHPDTVFSSIDQNGRYAYQNQPNIIQWNLARFAESLISILADEQEKAIEIATGLLNQYPDLYERYWLSGMRAKLGLQSSIPADRELILGLLTWMQKSNTDFTNGFRDLSEGEPMVGSRYEDPEFQAWYSQWRLRLDQDGRSRAAVHAAMRAVNPAIIPRNHRVEAALAAAQDHDDLSVMHELLMALETPYESNSDKPMYRDPPQDDRCYKTFCGT